MKIRNLGGLFALALMLPLASFGQGQAGQAAKKPVAQVTKTPTVKRPVKGLYWRVSSPSSSIYLLGSIHLGSKAMYPLPDYMEREFKEAGTLVVEVNIAAAQEGEGQAKMMQYVMANGMYQDDDNLWKHVSKNTRAKVEKFCKAHQIPAMMASKMKPWLLAMTASVMPSPTLQDEISDGVDMHFMTEAKNQKKKIQEAESLELQIKMLADIPAAEQEKYLVTSMNSAGQSKDMLAKMQDIWIDGDIEKTNKFLDDGFKGQSDLDKRLIDDRNPHMADVAESFLKTYKTCFFVVGAGHLVGKKGVIQMLKDRGYKVEQVLSDPGPTPGLGAKD